MMGEGSLFTEGRQIKVTVSQYSLALICLN